MKPKSTNSRSSGDSSRCRHTFANSQRCRLPVNEDSRFCTRHAQLPQNQTDSEDTSSLVAGLTEFTSAQPVNEFLSRLLLLLGQNRVSPRRASVLAYIATQILRTIAAMDREDERELDSEENRIEAFFPAPDELESDAEEEEEQEEEQDSVELDSAAAAESNSLHHAASRGN